MSLGIISGEDLPTSTCPNVIEFQFLHLHKSFFHVSRKDRSSFCHMAIFIKKKYVGWPAQKWGCTCLLKCIHISLCFLHLLRQLSYRAGCLLLSTWGSPIPNLPPQPPRTQTHSFEWELTLSTRVKQRGLESSTVMSLRATRYYSWSWFLRLWCLVPLWETVCPSWDSRITVFLVYSHKLDHCFPKYRT